MLLLLSPHNDDDALFCSFEAIRHKPLILTVLRSYIEAEQWGNGATWQVRDAESRAAARALGCDSIQWEHPDSDPDWDLIEGDLRALDSNLHHVWAPAVEGERRGHAHHEKIGSLAVECFGPERVTWYHTYNQQDGRSAWGRPEPGTAAEQEIKRRALACYPSQSAEPRTKVHFERPLTEYYSWPLWSSNSTQRS